MRLNDPVAATAAERREARPGDGIVAAADVVMDRGFTIAAPPETVWPWLAQLGKGRAGWYFPRTVERVIPTKRRAVRRLDARWTELAPGDVVPDYGGSFTVAEVQPPHHLVYRSQRGRVTFSWSIALRADGDDTRVLLRLRMAPVRRVWLARTAGEAIDWLTILGMAAGLRERCAR